MKKAPKFVVLTGAGISAESGISTFRDSDGLWENYSIEEVCTTQAIRDNPEKVYQFYNDRRADLVSKEPNQAHYTLALMEQKYGDDFVIVTQNVDDLHEKAESKNVIHIHGNLNEAICIACKRTQIAPIAFKPKELRCNRCNGYMRPNIVLFGEIPHNLDKVYSLLEKCTHFISIGTSGQVYPASDFVNYAKRKGKWYSTKAVNINPEKTRNGAFDTHIQEKATVGVHQYFAEFLND